MTFAKTLSRDEMKSIMAGNVAGDCVRNYHCKYDCCTWQDGDEVSCPCSTCCLALE